MDIVTKLEGERDRLTAAIREMLEASKVAGRGMSDGEREAADALTAKLAETERRLREERKQLEFDRTQAEAVDWPGRTEGAPRPPRPGALANDEDAPALRLPPVPYRTRQAIAAMAGGAAASPRDAREHFAAVVRAALGGDPFSPLLAATSTEGVPSEGGFAVRPDVSAYIWGRAAEESVWVRIGCRVEPMQSEERVVVALDDADESSDAEAGLAAGWTAEAAEATAQAMKIRQVTLHARKLMVLAAASAELADDAGAYMVAVEEALGRAIGKKFDRAVLSGTGVGQPLGILASPATVVQAKEAGQVADTIVWQNIVGMWSRLAPGAHERSYWITHPSALPQLLTMSLSIGVAGAIPPGVFEAGGPTGYQMLGRPVVTTGRAKPLGDKGDLLLVDPSAIAIGVRRQITIERSPHPYFASDRIAIRGKFRGDAAPIWAQAGTLQEGATTVSPYVVLAERA